MPPDGFEFVAGQVSFGTLAGNGHDNGWRLTPPVLREQVQRLNRTLRLFFVRHGESEANLLRVFSNRELPHGLTEHGRQQIAHLAQRLRKQSITMIFCSPVLPAVQSAELLSQQHGGEQRVHYSWARS